MPKIRNWQAEIDRESKRKYPNDPDRQRLKSRAYCAGKAIRHLAAIAYNELVDKDSGIPHTEKARWWLAQIEKIQDDLNN